MVRWLARGEYPAGYHTVEWDGRDGAGSRVAPGVYFLRSASGGEVHTRKVMVVR